MIRKNNGRRESLDEKMLQIHLSVSGMSFASTLFTSRPFTTAMTKRPFQIFILVMSLFMLTFPTCHWKELSRGATRDALIWRFSVLELRSATLAELDYGEDPPSLFVIKFQGVTIPFSSRDFRNDGSTAVLTAEAASVVDEWCFRTDTKSSSRDAVRFAVHGSQDGQSWEQIGSSVAFVNAMGGIAYYDGFFDTRNERGVYECFPVAPYRGWLVYSAGYTALSGLVMSVGTALAALSIRKEDTARKILALGFFLVGFGAFTLGCGAWRARDYDGCVFLLKTSVGPLIWAFVVFFREKQFPIALMSAPLLDLLSHCVHAARGGKMDEEHLFIALHDCVVLSVACWVFWYKRSAMAQAVKLVAPDKREYDAIWNKVREDEAEELAELAALVKASGLEGGKPVQTDARGRKKESLDLLFSEAECADAELRKRALGWAAAANGFLAAAEPRGAQHGAQRRRRDSVAERLVSAKYVSQLGEEECERRVKWCSIKTASRAIEKVYRSYSGEVAALCDVSRQSIIFDTVADLRACLAAVLADAESSVVRLKNRYDPAVDADASAGYRNLVLNLNLPLCEAARARRASKSCLELERGELERVERELEGGEGEWHVCEVQLQLASFYALRTDQGHARYVQFRNMCGE